MAEWSLRLQPPSRGLEHDRAKGKTELPKPSGRWSVIFSEARHPSSDQIQGQAFRDHAQKRFN
jgi:hypothetical protein